MKFNSGKSGIKKTNKDTMVSLIAGMDKIVEYITSLEIKNKKLDNKNKNYVKIVKIKQEKIKGLEEENKELEEKNIDLEMTDTEIADERLDEIIKLEGRIEELEDEKPCEELYELRKENEELEKKATYFEDKAIWAEDYIRDCKISAGCVDGREYAIIDLKTMIEKSKERENKLIKEIKELKEKVDEGLKYKELKELYEGRAKGMEEELNKIEKIVGIKESRIPEPNQVLNAVNKLNEEIKELKEFKEKTEDECEASAVMEDMMKRIQEAERKEKMWYESYKNQEPMVKANREQNEQLIKIVMKSYDLETQEYINQQGYWSNRFEKFYWNVVVENREIDWWNIFEEIGIECRNWDFIKEGYFEDKEIREQYCASEYVEHTQRDKIINDEDEDYDWDEQEENFIEWYIDEVLDACEYTAIDEDYYMLIR